MSNANPILGSRSRKWLAITLAVIGFLIVGVLCYSHLYQVLFAPAPEEVFGGPLPPGVGKAWTYRATFFGGDVEEYLAMEMSKSDYDDLVKTFEMGPPIGVPDIGRRAFERPASWVVCRWWDCSPAPNQSTYHRFNKGTGDELLMKYEDGKAFLIRAWF